MLIRIDPTNAPFMADLEFPRGLAMGEKITLKVCQSYDGILPQADNIYVDAMKIVHICKTREEAPKSLYNPRPVKQYFIKQIQLPPPTAQHISQHEKPKKTFEELPMPIKIMKKKRVPFKPVSNKIQKLSPSKEYPPPTRLSQRIKERKQELAAAQPPVEEPAPESQDEADTELTSEKSPEIETFQPVFATRTAPPIIVAASTQYRPEGILRIRSLSEAVPDIEAPSTQPTAGTTTALSSSGAPTMDFTDDTPVTEATSGTPTTPLNSQLPATIVEVVTPATQPWTISTPIVPVTPTFSTSTTVRSYTPLSTRVSSIQVLQPASCTPLGQSASAAPPRLPIIVTPSGEQAGSTKPFVVVQPKVPMVIQPLLSAPPIVVAKNTKSSDRRKTPIVVEVPATSNDSEPPPETNIPTKYETESVMDECEATMDQVESAMDSSAIPDASESHGVLPSFSPIIESVKNVRVTKFCCDKCPEWFSTRAALISHSEVCEESALIRGVTHLRGYEYELIIDELIFSADVATMTIRQGKHNGHLTQKPNEPQYLTLTCFDSVPEYFYNACFEIATKVFYQNMADLDGEAHIGVEASTVSNNQRTTRIRLSGDITHAKALGNVFEINEVFKAFILSSDNTDIGLQPEDGLQNVPMDDQTEDVDVQG